MVDLATPLDPDRRQREASDPETSVWLAASAGSGKTKVLTDRVLTLLLGGTLPGRILCLTFTKAAAAEMANRVTERLAEWATVKSETLLSLLTALLGRVPNDDETIRARRLFAAVLDVPGGLKIQTIHSFCESLIARFPFESGVPPHFEVMDERSATEIMLRARDGVLAIANKDAALADALSVLTRYMQEDRFAELIGVLSRERGRLQRGLDDHGGIEPALAAIFQELGVAEDETVETVKMRAVSDAVLDRENLKRAATALLQGTEKTDQPRGRLLADWLAMDGAERVDHFQSYLDIFFTKAGDRRARLMTAGAAKADPPAEEILIHEAARLEVVQESIRCVLTAHSSAALLRLGAALLNAYDIMKRHLVWLDYDDLIYKTHGLLTRSGIAPWVLFKLDGGLDHILIDEAQDTNPEQWAIVAALAEEFFAGESARPETRTIFAVGDVKQSIFSFQRAAPKLFDEFRDTFAAQASAVQRGWRDLDLSVSFRSTDAVLAAVDAVFARAPAREGVVTPDVALKHYAFREGAAGMVELWPAIGPEPANPRDAWTPPVERLADDNPSRRLAELIAAKIKTWIDQESLPARDRKMRAGDVMILLRRRSGFMEQIVAALKSEGVPVAGVDRMMLTEQLAVMDLMALGRFLLLPEDDLTLATILKSPLIGLDEDQLFRLAYDRGGESVWRRLNHFAVKDPRLHDACEWLKALLAKTDFERPFELFAGVLAQPVPAGASGREAMLTRLGPEADDPIDEYLNLAMAYEQAHVPSLEGFLHWMAAGAVEVKRDLEQSAANEVRVMTVHGAKGLQAPVVILPDTMAKPTSSPELLWLNTLPFWPPRRHFEPAMCRRLRAEADTARDEEYRRLLYVAMTRAEDRLYICGHHGARAPAEDCWYNLVRDGLADLADPAPFDFTAAIKRGWQGDGLRYKTAQASAPKADESDHDISTDSAALPDWVKISAPEEARPPKPLAPSRPSEAPSVASPLGSDDGQRFKRGLIIHRLLQTLPEVLAPDRPATAERLLRSRALALDPTEQRDIADTVLSVLENPDFADLFGPDSKAEVPLVGAIEMARGPEVIAGQVDRLVVRDSEVLIVDYKSMRPPPSAKEDVPMAYLRQMATYRSVLRRVWPDRPIRCALLWTENPSLMILDDAQLDSF
jgi:ATP-dependent helicase/nuclease subunit A